MLVPGVALAITVPTKFRENINEVKLLVIFTKEKIEEKAILLRGLLSLQHLLLRFPQSSLPVWQNGVYASLLGVVS